MAVKTKIINILPVNTTVTIEKQSPMFDLIGIEDVYVDYDLIDNNIVNLKVFLKKIEDLRSRSLDFDKEISRQARTLGVNLDNHLAFYINSRSDNKAASLKSIRKNISHIKLSSAISIDHVIEIKNTIDFSKDIFLHEISDLNEILGIAKISFSKKTIDIKESPLI